ncbi:MAG: hypothetical protein NDI77_00465 [Geobacteraceae bacterium]|nr:hypothetical protein [Geobacteraceae bacterium]
MSLPGGPADKLGNRYELWWTVSQLVRMLHGQAESIRIEDPGVTKAEFVIVSQGRRELHQAKRSHQDGKWSLSSLAGAGILEAIFTQLSGNDGRFTFVSSSDARELAELADRARQAESPAEFESPFLDAKEIKADFEKLKTNWSNTDLTTAYGILRRIEVRTIDERSLEEQVQLGLRSLFLQDTDAISAELRRIAEDSIHRTITRDQLVTQLGERGFRLRRLPRLEDAAALISEVTDRYIAVGKRKLIRKSLMSREATQTILQRIREESRGTDFILSGRAGSGKSGCVIELVESLRAMEIPVLAFRLDRLDPVTTSVELGQQLGLEESPTLVLSAAATGSMAVLIVDQLDAVSSTSGRNAGFLDAIENLMGEVRGLRDKLKLHVIVVCRTFDWENDHRLRRMLAESHEKIEATEFSPDVVRTILSAERFDTTLFQPRQLELLRLPQNLSLFLDIGFDPLRAPVFNTAKELFDRYWDTKRRAVAERTAPLPEQWPDLIQLLCDEMTRTQQLSVLREKLDRFANDYVAQMASEGVLTFDGKRYGFGHESFFDYCFARSFVARNEPITEFLTASEQHLFRRAQVRQVLTYLRDADRQRYCAEVRAILTDTHVRTHLKDLAITFITNLLDPGNDEWDVLYPLLESEVASLGTGQRNSDKFASLVWQHFFSSSLWFHLADERGLIAAWLVSDNNSLANMGVTYLRFHQSHSGDRVAELLEPYVGAGGEWRNRLRFVMEWADHENSRRFFELFLRLIDDGTLDEARGPIAVNSTFWSILHGLAEARPDWLPEVIRHWLTRRLLLVQQQMPEGARRRWRDIFNNDDFASTYFAGAAAKAPEEFVQNVLQVVLQISSAALYEEEDKAPRRDAVWPALINGNPSIDSACISTLVHALRSLAKEKPETLVDTIRELRTLDTYIANYLLMNIFTAGAISFADEAVKTICDQPWRLNCGFSGSPYWISMEAIAAVMPHCSEESRTKLETVILAFSPEYERRAEGIKFAGRACFALLSAIPAVYLTRGGLARFNELERKFGKPYGPPKELRAYSVGSPIPKEAAEKMTDEQWLIAIAKYRLEDRFNRWDNLGKGGAAELAGMLREYAKNEPERFARLSLQFPADTNPVYIERTLEGLKGASAPMELKLEVCRKAYGECREGCGKAIADLLGSIDETLPEDAVQMLNWLATEHPEPDRAEEETRGEVSHGNDFHTRGMNTARGRAAEAIRDLIHRDSDYIERFQPTLDHLAKDISIPVRSCFASTLISVGWHNAPLAMELFQIAATDQRLLETEYAQRFIYYHLAEHFDELRPFVEKILRSDLPNVSRAGGRLASIAALYHEEASGLVEEAISGTPSQRHGVAEVAAGNIADEECRAWCKERLLHFFHDPAPEVRREAASCFRQLQNEPLESYEDIITAFCDSPAYEEDSFPILHILKASLRRLPGITCMVCEKFLLRFSDEAKDIRTSRAGDVHTVVKLVFRTYHQHQNDEWASRCLDLIDRMCLEGIRDASKGFDEYER